MVKSKIVISFQSLLFLSRLVACQEPTRIVSIYIPGETVQAPGEVQIASQISVVGPTAFYEIVDENPADSLTLTFTVGLSPTGSSLQALAIDATGDKFGANTTCQINGNVSVCEQVNLVEIANGTEIVFSSMTTNSFTEAVTLVPVLAANFFTAPTPAVPTPTTTSTNSPPAALTPTNSPPAAPTPTNSPPVVTPTTLTPNSPTPTTLSSTSTATLTTPPISTSSTTSPTSFLTSVTPVLNPPSPNNVPNNPVSAPGAPDNSGVTNKISLDLVVLVVLGLVFELM